MLMLEISPFSLDKKRVIPASWLEQIPQESLKHKNFPEHLFRKPLRLVDAHDVNSNLVGGLEHEL
jgi:ABC-type sulfate transport system substrate-binding protein